MSWRLGLSTAVLLFYIAARLVWPLLPQWHSSEIILIGFAFLSFIPIIFFSFHFGLRTALAITSALIIFHYILYQVGFFPNTFSPAIRFAYNAMLFFFALSTGMAVEYNRKLKTLVRQKGEAEQRLKAKNAELELIARIDPLTHLFNRKHFFEMADRTITQTETSKEKLSLILLDIDHFKNVNDTHGHLAGDALLAHLAHLLDASCYSCNTIARYGGEEFILLLSAKDQKSAQACAEKIRSLVEQTPFHYRESVMQITLSLGVSEYLCGRENIDKWIARTDAALYRAKNAGRNRSEMALEEAVA